MFHINFTLTPIIRSLAKFETKGEIEWQQVLAEIFAGFSFSHNYKIDRFYEAQRELFLNNYRVIRFHHQVDLKTLFNSILRAKMGTITKLYNYVYPETSKSSATELNFC
ncbi:MAG: hypothetical protein DRR00_17855 [Candidatus Parabeggiatoa sp. nov. 3]|nr:MAG: hypothetical protein DRR00_17855 [Gammaproteobacteria bacterium]